MRRIKPLPLSHIDEAASIEAACLGSAWSAEQLADSLGREDFCYLGVFEDDVLAGITLLQMKSKSSIWRSNRNSVAAA